MKVFNASIANIKNSKGEYEPMAALRGLSSYELAVQNGFEGTEAEWMEMMLSDGWVGKYQELEANKANISDVYTKDKIIDDAVIESYGLDQSDLAPKDVFLNIGERLSTIEEGKENLKIRTGTYDGSNSDTVLLNTDIHPMMVWIDVSTFTNLSTTQEEKWMQLLPRPLMRGVAKTFLGDNTYHTLDVAWGDTFVEIGINPSAEMYLNDPNLTYTYTIIGY